MRKNNIVVRVSKIYDYPKGMLYRNNMHGDAINKAREDFAEDCRKGIDNFKTKVYDYYPLYEEDLQGKGVARKRLDRNINNERFFESIVKELVLIRNKEKYGNEVISFETTPELFIYDPKKERYNENMEIVKGAHVLRPEAQLDTQEYTSTLWNMYNNILAKEDLKQGGYQIKDILMAWNPFDKPKPPIGKKPLVEDNVEEDEDEYDED